jgi:anti-sigma regulatory factor (Ser/Thr protein kinase)
MEIRTLILNTLKKHGRVTTADLVGLTGLSRAYAQRFLKDLAYEGAIVLMGKANQAHYILPSKKGASMAKPLSVRRVMTNKGLTEDKVLREIKEKSAIFQGVAGNVSSIIDYSFTEMLNNAIEHSASEKVDVIMTKTATDIRFTVADRGIGIFNNIMKKKRLGTTIAAIQDLLKGKETTAPEAHSGEGIFFTSKIADLLTIKSLEKKLVYDNTRQDIYVKDLRPVRGTRVDFVLGLRSKKKLVDLFAKYADESFKFSKTGVKVKLYHQDVDYVSRSQARRILTGLEKFKTIELDFQDVKTIGQAFADEVFRIWQAQHQDVKFVIKDANENVMLMIKRAQP